MTCPHCNEPLNVSQHTPDRKHKSCTGCSQKAGQHVFHPVQEFGHHDPETDLPHSECDGCRRQLRQIAAQGFTAKEFPYIERLELIGFYVTLWTTRCDGTAGTDPPVGP